MTVRRIWVYRHGESVSNAGGRTFDVGAIPLTERGRMQAAALAAAIPQAPDLIVASPYLRSAQTAAPIEALYLSARREVWPIQEFTYLEPTSCVGTSWVERKPRIDAYWAALDPAYVDGAGAESFATLLERARGFLERLRTVTEDFVVCVSHGQFMQATLLLAEAPDMASRAAMALFRDRQAATPFANGALLRLEVRDGVVRVAGR